MILLVADKLSRISCSLIKIMVDTTFSHLIIDRNLNCMVIYIQMDLTLLPFL